MRNKIVLPLIVGVALHQSVHSQIVVSASVDKAIAAAQQKSLTLKEKQIETQKIESERQEVWQKYLPTIEASGTYLYAYGSTTTDLPTLHTPLLGIPFFEGSSHSTSHANLLMGSVTAKMVLFSGLQIPYGAKALKQKQIGTQHLGQVISDEIIQEIIVAFDQIKVLEAVQTLIDDSKKRLETEIKRVEKGIELGLAIALDRDKIKLAQLELQSKQIELDGNKKLIFKKIGYFTGWDMTQIQSINHSFLPFILDQEQTYSAENKPEIKALQEFVKAQEFVLKKEKSAFLPQVIALAGVRYTSLFDTGFNFEKSLITKRPISLKINEITMYPTWFVGVGAKWEIFSGLGRIHKIKRAKLDIISTEDKLKDTQDKLALLLDKNMENYRVMSEKLNVLQQKEHIAKNNLNTAIRQYSEGLIDISERLEVENDYYKVVIEQVQGIQQQRQSAIEVVKTTGKLADYIVTD